MINDPVLDVQIDDFVTSDASCSITYSASISPTSGGSFITFDASNKIVSVYSDDNQYGG